MVKSLPPWITDALSAVDEDHFVRSENGGLLPQSSSAYIIAEMLRLLDPRPGMRVLEIGTGSGFSTALLALLTGPAGHVVSVDVVPELVTRAADKLGSTGYRNVTVLCADGAGGAAEHGPYDRVIAWATAPHLPAAWVAQAAPGAMIVAPVALAPLAAAGAGVIVEIDADGQPVGQRLFPAGFVGMHAEVVTDFHIPPYGVDVLQRGADGTSWWLSGEHLRKPDQTGEATTLLATLAGTTARHPALLTAEEPVAGLRAWLLATRPPGLTTAALGEPLWRIGHTTTGAQHSAALVSMRDGMDTAVTHTSHESLAVVEGWVDWWRSAGRPGLDQLHPILRPTSDGWTVTASTTPARTPR